LHKNRETIKGNVCEQGRKNLLLTLNLVFFQETQINYIWKYRRLARLAQKQIAHLLGCADHTQFSKWERGEKLPNLQNALRLAYILQTPVESLFGGLYRNVGEEVEEKRKSLPKEVKRSSHGYQFSGFNS
jgi:DNA-binding XRE family transcriptional regulator